jgi:phosphoglucosamine mutase
MGRLFGTDGVRGPGDGPLLTDPTIGAAIAQHYEGSEGRFIIGYDPRESSPNVVATLASGMVAVGAEVEVVGVIPTPGLAYLARTEPGVIAGAMITASHNKYSDNGIKLFDPFGNKLSDEAQLDIEELWANDVSITSADWGLNSIDPRYAQEYEDFLIANGEGVDLSSLRIGIDMANGAASGFAERIFTRLGAKVTPMANRPDGRNINERCGATHLDALQGLVASQELDLGIAFDGDADRAQFVDSQGRIFDGDHILYTLATSGEKPKAVVGTIMTNLGTERALNSKGIRLVRTDVGDRNILEAMREDPDLHIGAEQSGHVILSEGWTGDGMRTAIHTLRAVRQSGRTLAELRDEVRLVPQKIINIPLANGDKALLSHPLVQTYIGSRVAALSGRARLSIRPSGTEDLGRVTVQSDNAEEDASVEAEALSGVLAQARAEGW